VFMSDKGKRGNMIITAAKAEVCAYAVTAVIFILCAVLLTYTNLEENIVSIVSAVCTFLSAFLSGYIISSDADKGGIFWGMLGGLSYAAILMAVLFLAGKNSAVTAGKIFCLVLSLFGGALGGIFGINSKK